MIRNIKIHSHKIVTSTFKLKMYKISLVHLGEQKYTKGRLFPLRAIGASARPMLVKNKNFNNQTIDRFKVLDNYNDCFVFVKNDKKSLSSLGLEIAVKSNVSAQHSDSLINKKSRQEITKMLFDGEKPTTTKNILLVSSKRKYEFLNNYTSF